MGQLLTIHQNEQPLPTLFFTGLMILKEKRENRKATAGPECMRTVCSRLWNSERAHTVQCRGVRGYTASCGPSAFLKMSSGLIPLESLSRHIWTTMACLGKRERSLPEAGSRLAAASPSSPQARRKAESGHVWGPQGEPSCSLRPVSCPLVSLKTVLLCL